MRSALGESHRSVSESEFGSSECLSRIASPWGSAGCVIVPAAGAVRPETFGAVAKLLDNGATVVWESGAAFLDAAKFAEQRALTTEHFGISMERPVAAWLQSGSRVGATNQRSRNACAMGHERVPYVSYHWPSEVHIRDFSRMIPVSAGSGRAIAHWNDVPVAWRRSIGAGTLIFVGSPIGPAIHAGDSDAHSLIRSFASAT